jgi:hypothetical protein
MVYYWQRGLILSRSCQRPWLIDKQELFQESLAKLRDGGAAVPDRLWWAGTEARPTGLFSEKAKNPVSP